MRHGHADRAELRDFNTRLVEFFFPILALCRVDPPPRLVTAKGMHHRTAMALAVDNPGLRHQSSTADGDELPL